MKRRLLQIIVLLVLGAIVNVAVAWGCAAVRSTKFVSVDHVNYHFEQSSLQWYMLRLECRSNDRLVWSVSPSIFRPATKAISHLRGRQRGGMRRQQKRTTVGYKLKCSSVGHPGRCILGHCTQRRGSRQGSSLMRTTRTHLCFE